MAHKSGNILCQSVKFNYNSQTGRFKFPYYPEYTKPFIYGYYVELAIPAIGSTVTDDGTTAGQLRQHEGPEYAGIFAVPYDCRVVGIGYCLDFVNPSDGCTGLRIGVMNCQFEDQSGRTVDATWKCLARLDTTAMTGDPAGSVQKGAATFTSSDGDVAAGELVGIVLESLGSSTGSIWGCMTIMLEAR